MGVLGEDDEMRQLRIAAVRGLKWQDCSPQHECDGRAEELTEISNGRLMPLASCHRVTSELSEQWSGMSCYYGEEQWLISSGQRKYGTTSTNKEKPERLIRYDVKEDDTLQGIALKHDVTMEQLKRVNKLWTNDSLIMRRTLLIPLPLRPSAVWSDSDDGQSSTSSGDASRSAVTADDDAPPARSAADFFRQKDSVIASSRRKVYKLQLE